MPGAPAGGACLPGQVGRILDVAERDDPHDILMPHHRRTPTKAAAHHQHVPQRLDHPEKPVILSLVHHQLTTAQHTHAAILPATKITKILAVHTLVPPLRGGTRPKPRRAARHIAEAWFSARTDVIIRRTEQVNAVAQTQTGRGEGMTRGGRYHSLEEFLTASEAHVDGVLNDGWGASFPVKGREIQATVLFADISGFSGRTAEMSPVETLIFVNNFFAWISAEALEGRPGIVDKYIGDEVMVVFAREFGSEDPFADALVAAANMSRHDVLAFCPHVGIASGPVIVGYVGTPMRYSASVFGAAVAMAARCAAVKPPQLEDEDFFASSWVTFPASEWSDHSLEDLLGDAHDRFEVSEPFRFSPKNLPDCDVRQVVNRGLWMPMESAEARAQASLSHLKAANRYWPAID